MCGSGPHEVGVVRARGPVCGLLAGLGPEQGRGGALRPHENLPRRIQPIQIVPGRLFPSSDVPALRAAFSAARALQILDLGCGPGALDAQLVAAGFEVTGVDPHVDDGDSARRAVPGARLLCAMAEDLPDELGPFAAACGRSTTRPRSAPKPAPRSRR